MKPREQRIVTAFINTVKQNVYTVDQVILMAEDFYNRHMLTEDALEELHDKLDKMDAPPVDAVSIIRCKKCKHSKPWYRDKRLCFLWDKDGIDVFEDGYCNYSDPTWKDLTINER